MTRTVPALRALALAAALAISGASTASAKDVQGGVTLDQAPVPDSVLFPTVEGLEAKMQKDGTAAAPALAPDAVKKAIWAANKIIAKPYRYGGGHRRFNDSGYDCSGTVSYALKGGSLLKAPLDSSSFMAWGLAGPGEWITVYTNPGHAFVVIAGLRLDTSASGDPSGNKGPRWRPVLRSTSGFTARHPEGL
jgi:cell wall-associated NlpC family hydrolase